MQEFLLFIFLVNINGEELKESEPDNEKNHTEQEKEQLNQEQPKEEYYIFPKKLKDKTDDNEISYKEVFSSFGTYFKEATDQGLVTPSLSEVLTPIQLSDERYRLEFYIMISNSTLSPNKNGNYLQFFDQVENSFLGSLFHEGNIFSLSHTASFFGLYTLFSTFTDVNWVGKIPMFDNLVKGLYVTITLYQIVKRMWLSNLLQDVQFKLASLKYSDVIYSRKYRNKILNRWNVEFTDIEDLLSLKEYLDLLLNQNTKLFVLNEEIIENKK